MKTKTVLVFLFSVCIFSTSAQILITAVYDCDLPGGLPKGVELYALEDIPDLSRLGIGSANNGGGSDSVEFSFPSDGVLEGNYLYVSSETQAFEDFFGFAPDYDAGTAMAINGDDAIELFWDGVVIDVFGNINEDGTMTDWEYTNGWASRKPDTGPDGSTFVLANWNFSGPGGIENATSNASAPNPVPIRTYGTAVTPDVIVLTEDLQFIPRDITIEVGQTVRWTNPETNVLHNVNGSVEDYPCNPVGFFSGVAEAGPWDFDVTFNTPGFYAYQCDPHVASDMFGTVTVVDPEAPAYPAYAISLVKTNDADGVADSIGAYCTLEGVVYGPNLRPGGLQFTIIDDAGTGIGVFEGTNTCYPVTEGDRVRIQGQISQFSGLTQINPQAQIEVLSQGNPLRDPITVDNLGEETESAYIRLEDVLIESVFGSASGFNVTGSNANGVHVIRLDIDVFPDEMYAEGLVGKTVNVTGIGGQFDTSEPLLDGYQILPGSTSDIEEILAVPFIASSAISIQPNPVRDRLEILTDEKILRLECVSLDGAIHKRRLANGQYLDFSDEQPGLYVIRIYTERGLWTNTVVKLE